MTPHVRTPVNRALRAVTLCVATAVALLLGSAPAWAHTALLNSDPAQNAALATAPSAVSLTFDEEIDPGLAKITISGPAGGAYEAGPASATGMTLRVPLRPLGPAGGYRISYRVISDDGHPVSGTVAFTLTKPGPGAGSPPPQAPASTAPAAPAPAAASSSDGGTPVWPWIVGAVVIVGAGAALALRRGKA